MPSFETDNPCKNIAMVSVKLDNIITNPINMSRRTLTAEINEMMVQNAAKRAGKAGCKKHIIVLQFTGEKQNISSAMCTQCSAAKENCSAILSFMHWIQRQHHQGTTPAKKKRPIGRAEGNAAKKPMFKRECSVVLQRFDVGNHNTAHTTVKTEHVPYTPTKLEQARRLSMVHLIREFEGNDVDQFLAFCNGYMKSQMCKTAALLTFGQADTQLWHELHIGRITGSCVQETARCTTLNRSLTKKIMGASSGFSSAMKSGTALEGHVLNELRKAYPGLQNSGLVLNPKYPWIGVSPDGICEDFVLEIKCPYTAKTPECYVNMSQLGRNYYIQMQLQMHITQRKKALLAVAATNFEETKRITKLWIYYNKKHIDKVMQEAFEYWRGAIFKALLRKRTGKQ
uniref:YqaJ domain-containing protein n=1 Tax=Anopheles minimus TaxID=112268 RepID=A0A182VTE5_9DIPT